MNDRELIRRIAGRHLFARQFFEIGDPVLFGKYKNKREKSWSLYSVNTCRVLSQVVKGKQEPEGCVVNITKVPVVVQRRDARRTIPQRVFANDTITFGNEPEILSQVHDNLKGPGTLIKRVIEWSVWIARPSLSIGLLLRRYWVALLQKRSGFITSTGKGLTIGQKIWSFGCLGTLQDNGWRIVSMRRGSC